LACGAAPGEPTADKATQPADVALIPAEGGYVISMRVADLWAADFTRSVRAKMKQELAETALGLEETFGAPPERIERLTHLRLGHFYRSEVTLLRLNQPIARDRVIALAGPGARPEKYNGGSLYVGKNLRTACLIDSRTYALGRQSTLQRWLDALAERKAGPLVPVRKALLEGHTLVVGVDVPELAKALEDVLGVEAEAFQPLLEGQMAVAVADAGSESRAVVRFLFADATDAAAGERALRAGVRAARTAIADGKAARGPAIGPLLDLADLGLQGASIWRDGTALVATARARTDPAVLMPACVAALQWELQAAARSHSANNLERMALAMHNYAGAYESRVPPAASYDKSGKPLLSWRVLLLPFLGEADLYKQFKLDEPWDGPHNKKLLDKMPLVYLAPGQTPSGRTHYQVFTGKGTLFDGKKTIQIGRIPDGTSNTIFAAEAAKAVPWTKPEDLAYDPDKPFPKLGGLFPGGFHVVMADGSAHFLSEKISAETLHHAIQCDDGVPLGYDFYSFDF
jgi:hypothetical protein